MKNSLLSFWPSRVPDYIAKQSDLQIQKEKILQSLLVAVGLAALVFTTWFLFAHLSSENPIKLTLYSFAIVACWAFIYYRRVPYTFRSSIFLTAILAIWLLTFRASGALGNGSLWLIALNGLTIILLGWKVGLICLALTQSLNIWMGYLAFNQINFLPGINNSTEIFTESSWLINSISLALISSVVTLTVGSKLKGLENLLSRSEKLATELSKERFRLQERVEQRTQALQRRNHQVITAATISQAVFTITDPKDLLDTVANLVRDQFDLYYVGVFILDENNVAVLKAGTGEAGAQMLAANHRLRVGSASMIGWAIANKQARIALDVGEEAMRFNNPYLPQTRSEVALPIMSRSAVMGALTIQSDKPDAFEKEDIQILQGIADSLAIALQNAELFARSQQAVHDLRSINRSFVQNAWSQVTKEYGQLSYTFEHQDYIPQDESHLIKIPIMLRDQEIGQIEVESKSSAISSDQVEFVETITTQTALALENARLLEDSQQRINQEKMLNQLSSEYSRAFTIDDILQTTLYQLSKLSAIDEVSVQLLPPATNKHHSMDGNGHNRHLSIGEERNQ